MIDTTAEDVFPLTATDRFPRIRRGRKLHPSTAYRWSTTGCQGIVLETIQVGGSRCTSSEALQRLFENLTRARRSGTPAVGAAQASGIRTSAARRRAADSAGRELERLGA